MGIEIIGYILSAIGGVLCGFYITPCWKAMIMFLVIYSAGAIVQLSTCI